MPRARPTDRRQRRRVPTLTLLLAFEFALAITLTPRGAWAQRTRVISAVADSMIKDALSTAALGDTTRALEALDRANRAFPKEPEVLYWRGVMLARTTFLRIGDIPRNWLAGHLLDKAAELDPKNPRYLLEIGRIRLYTPLLRIEAERIFRKAMKVAEESGEPSQIADIAWELGQIKERRYQTVRNRYLVSNPGSVFDAGAAIAQKHYTREFLEQQARPMDDIGSVDRSEAEELYRRGLRALPVHEANAVGLLGLLYDQNRFSEMREVVRPFIEANTGSARMRFGAGLAAYRTGAMADAEKLFDDALARLTEAERLDASGLSRIVRKRDAESYEALSPSLRLHTDSAFWEAADPLLSTPENEGRLEFLARVALADLRFSSSDMRQVGWRTDRGLILIRYGEAPVIATFAPSSSFDEKDAIGRVTTVWFYPNKERTFVFMGPPAMNYATFAGYHRGYAEEGRETAPFLLDNVAFAAGIDSIPMQVARFRGQNGGNTQMVVAAAVNTRNMYEGAEIDRSALALSLRIGPPSRMKVSSLDTIAVTFPATAPVSRTWIRPVPVGPYRVRVEAQDVAVRGATGRAQADVEIVAPVTGRFALSDVMFTGRTAAPELPISGLADARVTPRADLSFAQRELFSIYWENYDARPDAAGRVHFDVKIEVTLLEIDRASTQGLLRFLGDVADVVGLTKEGDEQLGIRFQRDEPLNGRDRVPLITTIGLGTSPAGRYRLELIVKDKTSGAESRTQREFRLRKDSAAEN